VGSPPEADGLVVSDPTRYFADHLQRSWAAAGLPIGQLTLRHQRDPMAAGWTEVAAIASPPLADLVKTTNQQSDNLYAETLLRTLGAAAETPATDTLEAGLEQVGRQLTALGVDPAGYALVDGSGLSRRNWISPRALGQTLQLINVQPQGALYRGSQNRNPHWGDGALGLCWRRPARGV
jgi:serine-type D-Ala-D-Ala carboxypeptidase/endopeptidase (penicillin-binding protein 4)